MSNGDAPRAAADDDCWVVRLGFITSGAADPWDDPLPDIVSLPRARALDEAHDRRSVLIGMPAQGPGLPEPERGEEFAAYLHRAILDDPVVAALARQDVRTRDAGWAGISLQPRFVTRKRCSALHRWLRAADSHYWLPSENRRQTTFVFPEQRGPTPDEVRLRDSAVPISNREVLSDPTSHEYFVAAARWRLVFLHLLARRDRLLVELMDGLRSGSLLARGEENCPGLRAEEAVVRPSRWNDAAYRLSGNELLPDDPLLPRYRMLLIERPVTKRSRPVRGKDNRISGENFEISPQSGDRIKEKEYRLLAEIYNEVMVEIPEKIGRERIIEEVNTRFQDRHGYYPYHRMNTKNGTDIRAIAETLPNAKPGYGGRGRRPKIAGSAQDGGGDAREK